MARIYSRHGCSGAPAFDLYGRLLGIVHGYSIDVCTFFIPISVVNALKEDIISEDIQLNRCVYPGYKTWCNSNMSDRNIDVSTGSCDTTDKNGGSNTDGATLFSIMAVEALKSNGGNLMDVNARRSSIGTGRDSNGSDLDELIAGRGWN